MFYQTFGLYHLAWPRHTLLREAGRRLCQRLLQRWMSKDSKPLRDAVQTWVQEQWAHQEMGSDAMIGRLRDACQELLRQEPEDAFAAVVEPLVQHYAATARAGSRSRPGEWGCVSAPSDPSDQPAPDASAVLAELEGMLGTPREEGMGEASGALVRRLREASEAVVNDWGQKLAQITVHLIEEPEYRLAGAEEAVRQVVATIEQVLQRHEPLERELAAKAAAGHARLLALLAPAEARRQAADRDCRRGYGAAARLPEMAVPEPGVAAGVGGVFEPARPSVRRAARDQLLPRAPGRAAPAAGGAGRRGRGGGAGRPAGAAVGVQGPGAGRGRLPGRRDPGGALGAGRADPGRDPPGIRRAGPRLPGQRQPAEERRAGPGGDGPNVRRRAAGRNQRGAAVPGPAPRRGGSQGRGGFLLQ